MLIILEWDAIAEGEVAIFLFVGWILGGCGHLHRVSPDSARPVESDRDEVIPCFAQGESGQL